MRQGPTVLVVEDEDDVRDVVRMVLEKNGFDVIEAVDAGQGWEILQRHPVAALVLDYCLPGLDGSILARQLKQTDAGRRMPVVLFTSWPVNDPALARLPFDAMLPKPDITSLVSTLRRLLAPPPSAAGPQPLRR